MFKFIYTILLSLAFAFNLTAEITQHSTIKITDLLYNFGTVSEGTKVTHDFTVNNVGNSALQVFKIMPSCGCTVSSLNPAVIEAGQTGQLHVEFDTTGFSGEKTKTVTLLTNDPFNEKVVLTLTGLVNQDVIVEPRQVYLPNVIKDGNQLTNASATVAIKVSEKSKIELGAIKSFSKFITIREVEATTKNKLIELTIAPDVSLGELRESLVVPLLGSTTKNNLTIAVFANISGPLKLSQNVISFGILPKNQKLRKSIKLENSSTKAVKIERIVAKLPELQTSFVEVQTGKTYIIHVDLASADVTADIRSSVQIFTNFAAEPLTFSVAAMLPAK